jgi:inhibitor of cysteine peptidase
MSKLCLGPADSGREVTLKLGDRVLIRLPENPSTGYRWAVDVPDVLNLTRDENEPGEAPGAAGFRVFEFMADALGRAAIDLGCGRAWEPAAPPIDRFHVTLEVIEGDPPSSGD